MKNTEITQVKLTLNGHDYYDSMFVINHIKNVLANADWREHENIKSIEPFCLITQMEHIKSYMCGICDSQYGTPYGESTVRINSLHLEDYKKASQWLKSLKKVKMKFDLPAID